jgi:hypothetical protein
VPHVCLFLQDRHNTYRKRALLLSILLHLQMSTNAPQTTRPWLNLNGGYVRASIRKSGDMICNQLRIPYLLFPWHTIYSILRPLSFAGMGTRLTHTWMQLYNYNYQLKICMFYKGCTQGESSTIFPVCVRKHLACNTHQHRIQAGQISKFWLKFIKSRFFTKILTTSI